MMKPGGNRYNYRAAGLVIQMSNTIR